MGHHLEPRGGPGSAGDQPLAFLTVTTALAIAALILLVCSGIIAWFVEPRHIWGVLLSAGLAVWLVASGVGPF
jgi:hypothetical protein